MRSGKRVTSPKKKKSETSHQRKKDDIESWKRIMKMVIAITIHNFPEGLAVGVAFGSIGRSPSATLSSARNLAIGIGIQNFPGNAKACFMCYVL